MAKTVFRALTLLGLLLCSIPGRLLAQDVVGMHITALTSAERDVLTARLNAQGDVEVIYTCVPAGVMVVRSIERSGTRAVSCAKARAALMPIVAAARITDDTTTLEQAQEECARTRN